MKTIAGWFAILATLLAGPACGGGTDGPVSAGAHRDAPADGGSVYFDAPDEPDASPSDADVREESVEEEPYDRILREGDVGTVTLVVDGDTVHVTIRGWYHRVRLQGVNAPECDKGWTDTEDGRQFVCIADQEWWGLNAYEAMRERASGAVVTIHCDQPFGEECPLDTFDRYLAFLDDDEGDVGEWLAANGHAMSFTKYASSRRAVYCEAEDQAIEQGLGMWSLGSRDEVLDRMNENTQDWYQNRDARCAEAIGAQ